MKFMKFWIIIVLLLLTIALSFGFPKAKYVGTDILSKLEIPYKMDGWQGKDIATELNLQDERYNFVSQIIAREYVNMYGENLLLLILDAGNFHYPKVCFTASGFKVRELKDTEFYILNQKVNAHTTYTEKNKEKFLIIYWISINKNIAPHWMEQKLKQLYFSLFNKKRVGLMVRLDIPIKGNNIDDAISLSREFINNLSQTLPSEHADYIFGRK